MKRSMFQRIFAVCGTYNIRNCNPRGMGDGGGAGAGASCVLGETHIALSVRLCFWWCAYRGYYLLLSNLYTTKQQYSEATLLRNEAKIRKLMKTPGCTLIEIGIGYALARKLPKAGDNVIMCSRSAAA